jgi:hypothetical protein
MGEWLCKIMDFFECPTNWITLLSLCIATFVAWIGHKTYWLSRANLRWELFQNRYIIYKSVMKFHEDIAQGNVSWAKAYDDLFDITEEAKFFFPAKQLFEEMNDLLEFAKRLEKSNPSIDGIEAFEEGIKRIKGRFHEYMDFSKWK